VGVRISWREKRVSGFDICSAMAPRPGLEGGAGGPACTRVRGHVRGVANADGGLLGKG